MPPPPPLCLSLYQVSVCVSVCVPVSVNIYLSVTVCESVSVWRKLGRKQDGVLTTSLVHTPDTLNDRLSPPPGPPSPSPSPTPARRHDKVAEPVQCAAFPQEWSGINERKGTALCVV